MGIEKPNIEELPSRELSEREKKVLSMTESASKSFDKASLENRINYANSSLQELKAGDWGELKAALQKTNLNEEEESAVQDTISILQALRSLEDKESVVKRAATKITEISLANKVFNAIFRHTPSSPILNASVNLYEATAYFASEEDKKESLKHLPGVMSEEEFQAAKERAAKVKVS